MMVGVIYCNEILIAGSTVPTQKIAVNKKCKFLIFPFIESSTYYSYYCSSNILLYKEGKTGNKNIFHVELVIN